MLTKQIFKGNLLLIIVMLFSSCGDNSQINGIEYDSQQLEKMGAKAVSLNALNDTFVFGYPAKIDFLTDSLLVIYDDSAGDNLCYIFTNKGEFIKSFGRMGRGPGEVILPVCSSVSRDSKQVYIYDYMSMKYVRFDRADILNNKTSSIEYSLKSLLTDSEQKGGRFQQILNIRDDKFIAFGNTDQPRILCFSDSLILDQYTQYPKVAEDREHCWSIWGNQALYSISPDASHLVITTRIGALFEVLDLDSEADNDIITLRTQKAIYKPKYSIAKGAIPACVIFNAETIEGFSSLYAADDCFYGVIGGYEQEGSNEIVKFDYNGDLISKYNVDENIISLAVDKNERVYLMSEKDGEIGLKYVDL